MRSGRSLIEGWVDVTVCVWQENEFEPIVLGYFDENTNSDDIEAFKQIAGAKGSIYRFGLTTSRSILETKKYDGCALVVYPPVRSPLSPLCAAL